MFDSVLCLMKGEVYWKEEDVRVSLLHVCILVKSPAVHMYQLGSHQTDFS